jgi:hypothetical protein
MYTIIECFNCTTLERMERRLRNVEESIRIGTGNDTYSFGSHHQRTRTIRPGRPDMSHVNGPVSPKG